MTQIHNHNGVAYQVIRTKPITYFAEKFDEQPVADYVNAYRAWVGADIILHTPTHFMFCKTIQDVEFEEIQNVSNTQ